MSPMSVALPLRTPSLSPSTSITLLPCFNLCYADKPAALAHLLEQKAPLPSQELFANNEFITYIISKEPGPSVQYENLRPALTALRSWLKLSLNGRNLLVFYKDFLQLHGQWVMAAAEQAAFEIHSQLTSAIYLKQGGDQKLLTHLEKHIPDANNRITSDPMNYPAEWEAHTRCRGDALKQKAEAFALRLHNLKTSHEFWTQHGRLLAAVEFSEKRLEKLRAQKKSRNSSHSNVRRRNDRVNVRQLGTGGTVPHLPHIQESLRDFAKEEKANYFNFNEAVVGAAA